MSTPRQTPPRRRGTPAAHDHQFSAPIEPLRFGRMQYNVVYLPPSLAALPAFAARRLRMTGLVAGQPVERAWQPTRDGRLYLLIGGYLGRQAGVGVGDRVTVSFSLVDDDRVAVPAEIVEALRQEPAWRKPWRALTPGKQRGLAHFVDSARGPETRARRATEVLEKLAAGLAPR